jgi:poly(3-hydroxybutyrate) depolymerase
MWVHGGGWQIGGKSNQMTNKVKLLNDLGDVVVSVNYRLTDPSSANPVQYPTHAEDVAAAAAWVHENVTKYGGDPKQIALMGHSAGAQIVANIATDPQFLAARDLALDDLACVAPLDTEGFDVTRQGQLGTPSMSTRSGRTRRCGRRPRRSTTWTGGPGSRRTSSYAAARCRGNGSSRHTRTRSPRRACRSRSSTRAASATTR